MCQQHIGEKEDNHQILGEPVARNGSETPLEPFPWDAGVFDAHCHPTDIMASVGSIPDMKARVLTVMATRSQDQDLVFDVASQQGVQDSDILFSPTPPGKAQIIPSFGWHPWFSYQLYDDSAPEPTYDGTPAGKIAHYDRILAPAPSSKDVTFSEGLPDPRPLSDFLQETRTRLEKYPLALIGEIGIDKAFRLPQSWTSAHKAQRDEGLTPGGREDRLLSPHRVQLAHQATVLQAQLRLAGQMGRAVSVHGVQAHGVLYDTISECWKGHEKKVMSQKEKRKMVEKAENLPSSENEDDGQIKSNNEGKLDKTGSRADESGPKPYPPRICIHSFSGPVDFMKQYLQPSVPAKVFFSFSIVINWGASGGEKTEEAIRVVPDDRILVESDLHTAGAQMDQYLEEVCRKICSIKGWELRVGVEKLAQNWKEFALG